MDSHKRTSEGRIMTERMTKELIESPAGFGHLFRYRTAMGFVNEGDSVLDAACGIGYAVELLPSNSKYTGIDLFHNHDMPVIDNSNLQFIKADLGTWEMQVPFDVGISFETIEHVSDYDNLITQLKKAIKWIIVSVPTIPSKHFNPYHLHDFKSGDLLGLFEDDKWQHFQTVAQPSEFSEIAVFKNRSYNEFI